MKEIDEWRIEGLAVALCLAQDKRSQANLSFVLKKNPPRRGMFSLQRKVKILSLNARMFQEWTCQEGKRTGKVKPSPQAAFMYLVVRLRPGFGLGSAKEYGEGVTYVDYPPSDTGNLPVYRKATMTRNEMSIANMYCRF